MMKNLGLPQCWRCIHPVVVIRKSGCGSQRKFASLEVATASAPTRAAGSTFMEFPPILTESHSQATDFAYPESLLC